MGQMKVTVPDIGNYHDVPVIELLVKDGDQVEKDTPLLVLESDKATLEVPAPAAGIVRGLKLKIGDKVSKGTEICALEAATESRPLSPAAEGKEGRAPPPAASAPAAPSPQTSAGSAAEAERPADAPASVIEVRVPDIGNYHDVPVIELLVKDGDQVEKDAPLLVLESDKATLEVPAPAAGIVQNLQLKIGDKVSKGDLIGALQQTGIGAIGSSGTDIESVPVRPIAESAIEKADAPTPAPVAAPTAPATSVSITSAPAAPTDSRYPIPDSRHEVPYAGPATRKFARELGVDLAQVSGSGRRGRIVIEDVQGFVKQRLAQPAASTTAVGGGSGIPAIPTVDLSQFGAIETRPLARIRKLSAAHLHRSWLNVPHVTQHDEVDITDLETFRKAQSDAAGAKLTLLPFIIKAVSVALKQYPEFNASLAPDGENLILKQYVHIGFAADTPNGLVVPVLRDADRKGIVELARETAELARKAREGKLKPDEMKGGCFSISSLGGIGGSFFTPIVNAPEVGILGVSRSQIKPVWDGQAFQPRLLCPLSLSYDHRVIDGAYAARFIVLLGKLLGDLRLLTL